MVRIGGRQKNAKYLTVQHLLSIPYQKYSPQVPYGPPVGSETPRYRPAPPVRRRYGRPEAQEPASRPVDSRTGSRNPETPAPQRLCTVPEAPQTAYAPIRAV
jgi:hypothetical protein